MCCMLARVVVSARVMCQHVFHIDMCCTSARVENRYVLHIGTCCASARVVHRHVLCIGTCCASARVVLIHVAPSSTSGLYKEQRSSQSWSVGHNKPESQHLAHCLLILHCQCVTLSVKLDNLNCQRPTVY